MATIDFTQEYPFNAFKTVVIDGEVMVKVPKFYVRVYVPNTGKYAGMKCWEVSEDRIDDSFHLHPAFMRNGKELSHFYIGAYTAYKKVGNIAGSKEDETPWTNIGGLESARECCNRRGGDEGWHLQTIYERSALQILALLEMGHGDSQVGFGTGNVNTSSAVKTGRSTAVFHGIYELWGNYWEIVDGIKGDGAGNVMIWDNRGNQTYVNTGLKPATNNYIVDVYNVAGEGYNLGDTFIPSSVAKESSSAFQDMSYGNANDNFTVLLNADYKSGVTQPGIFAVRWDKSVNESGEDIAFRLAKYDVGLPYNVSAQFVYDGTEKRPQLDNFDSNMFILGGETSAIDAGTYTITVTPKDENYLWVDGTSGAKTITWTISRQPIDVVPTQKANITYTGEAQICEWNNYDEEKLTISGEIERIDAGSYIVNFVPTSNYMWSDNSTSAVSATWRIKRKVVNVVPSQSGTLTYNKAEQTPTWNNYNANELAVSGNTKGTSAGSYNVVFTPTANYCWNDNSTTGIAVTWYILRKPITTGVPTQSGTATYSGSSQSPTWDNFNTEELTISGTTSSSSSGTFTVSFTPTANYCWENSDITSKSTTWTVGKSIVGIVPSQSDTIYYTGSSQSPTWSNYDSNKLILGGTTSGTNATEYSATFTPKENYCWSDGTVTTKTVTWTIQRQRILVLPTQRTALTYNGSSQTVTWDNYSSTQLSVTGNSATNAGTHEAVFTPNTNYAWSDGTFAAKRINWTIGVLKLIKPSTASALTYTYDGAEKEIVVSNYNSTRMTQTGTLKSTNAGSFTITYELLDKINTSWNDDTTSNVVISWTINKQKVTVPDVTDISKTYNGSEQSPTISNYDSNVITVIGNRGTNAGNYTVTMSLSNTSNYEWTDGTITNKTANWTIAKALISVTPSQNGTLTYNGMLQTPSWSNYNDTQLTIGGTYEATNAGTYEATFTPTSNYEWAD